MCGNCIRVLGALVHASPPIDSIDPCVNINALELNAIGYLEVWGSKQNEIDTN